MIFSFIVTSHIQNHTSRLIFSLPTPLIITFGVSAFIFLGILKKFLGIAISLVIASNFFSATLGNMFGLSWHILLIISATFPKSLLEFKSIFSVTLINSPLL